MQIILSNWVFKPGIASTMVFLLLFPGMLGLANWQYHRADEKKQLLIQLDESMNSQFVAVSKASDLKKLDIYTPIKMDAKLDSEHVFYVENRPRNGLVAADVFVPVILNQGQSIMLNLGWLYLKDRNKLPSFTLPEEIKFSAIVDNFPEAGWELGDVQQPDQWPALIPRIERDKLELWLGTDVYPNVLRMKEPLNNNLNTEWTPTVMPPEKHLAYAFQWFSMAIALLLLYIKINTKRKDET